MGSLAPGEVQGVSAVAAAVATRLRLPLLPPGFLEQDEQLDVDERLLKFIARLPKAELHVHVEGTLEPGGACCSQSFPALVRPGNPGRRVKWQQPKHKHHIEATRA